MPETNTGRSSSTAWAMCFSCSSCHKQVNLLQGCKGGLLAAGDSHEVMCTYGTCQGMVATAFASSSSIDDQAQQELTSLLAWLNIILGLLPCVSPSNR